MLASNRKNTCHSNSILKVLGLLSCTALLSNFAVADGSTASQAHGYIELGAGHATDTDPKFRKFYGLDAQGSYAIFNFSAEKKPLWDSGETRYWSASGHNIGTDSRELSFKIGDYGRQKFSFTYSEISTAGLSDAGTIFTNPGSNSLSLPTNWSAATSTTGMSGLSGSLTEVNDEFKRRSLLLNYQLKASSQWSLEVSFKHETKDGSNFNYGVIGNTGGNPRSVALPRPVEYQVNELALRADHVGKGYSIQLGYDVSLFTNKNQRLSWDNPFLAINGWNTAAGYPSGRGSLALEPDNTYQQLFASGFMRISPASSLHASIHFATMEQDETLQAYTINPALTVTTPLPVNSLDGQVDIWRFKLGYQNRLSNRLLLRVNAAHEDRDNKTPRNLYIYVGGDSQDQDTATSSRARYNLPHSYRETKADGALRFRVGKASTVSATLKHLNIDRDYSETTLIKENTGQLRFETRPAEMLHSYLSLSQELRRTSAYRGDTPYLNSHTADFIASEPADERFENHPLLRKYYLAQRDREKITLGLNWTPNDITNFGLMFNKSEDDYTKSSFGLQKSEVRSVQVDLTIVKQDHLEWSNFASFEKYRSSQTGRYFRGGTNLAADIVDPTRDWQYRSEDRVKTLGSNLTVFNIFANTDMELGYLLAYSQGDLKTTTGSALSASPIPDQGDKLRRITADVIHHVNPKLDISLMIARENYRAKNFSYDMVLPNTMANVIAIGNKTPKYSAGELNLSFTYRY